MSRLVMLLLVVVGTETAAFAQQTRPQFDRPKVSIEIDGAYRATSVSFDDDATRTINVEPSRIATTYAVPAGVAFGGSGGLRLWKQLGVGVSVNRYAAVVDGNVSASIPHPFVFNQARQIAGIANGLRREELAITLQVRGLVPVSNRLSLAVFAGPAWISASQTMVTNIDYAETYPYDSATFRSALTASSKKTKVGVGLGADLAYFFSKQVGIGLGAKFVGGNVELPGIGGATVKSKTGGVDIGGGLRLRF